MIGQNQIKSTLNGVRGSGNPPAAWGSSISQNRPCVIVTVIDRTAVVRRGAMCGESEPMVRPNLALSATTQRVVSQQVQGNNASSNQAFERAATCHSSRDSRSRTRSRKSKRSAKRGEGGGGGRGENLSRPVRTIVSRSMNVTAALIRDPSCPKSGEEQTIAFGLPFVPVQVPLPLPFPFLFPFPYPFPFS